MPRVHTPRRVDLRREIASNAVNEYALLRPSDGKWTVLLCWQKISGGAVYKTGKSAVEISFLTSARQLTGRRLAQLARIASDLN
jgi:hypothetical protein